MRFGTIVLIVAIVLSGFPAIIHAWQLNLTGQDYTWNPVDPSPTHIVGIENPGGSTDPMFAWSLGLLITADASAIGSLEFVSATLPADYLLDGRSDGLSPAFVGPTASIAPIGDTDSLFTGIVVPGTGKNLLATSFVASPDANGIFYISAVPDEFTGANWFSSDFENARDFGNVPFGGGPVVIGSITVVPEPSSLRLIGQVLAILLLLSWHCRRRAAVASDAVRTAFLASSKTAAISLSEARPRTAR